MEQDSPARAAASSPATFYLDLLKRTLTNLVFLDAETAYDAGDGGAEARRKRENGLDWPQWGLTMVGLKRLDNVQSLAERVLRDNIPGDFFEAGVWRGGVAILMRAVLAAYGDRVRRVWLADSFEGLPQPDVARFPQDAGDNHYTYDALKVPLESVKANFERFGLLDDRLRFVKGFFSDTLAGAPVEKIALLRLDGDMYESTYVSLEALYDKVSPGGYVIIDDYGYIESCKQAVVDFLGRRNERVEFETVDWTGVFWRKPLAELASRAVGRGPAEIYNYVVNPSDNTAGGRVCRFVAERSRVLELGAGPGAIARVLATQKACVVVGADIDPGCVAALAGFCETALRIDLNEPGWRASLPAGEFDTVVLADVLEHLVNPWATLAEAADIVASHGEIVVSLPHAGHVALVAGLLDGRFPYGEWGLLDRTHIRFFGLRDIQALFEGAGLAIVDVGFVLTAPGDSELAVAWNALAPHQQDVLSASPFASIYQVVIKAAPRDRVATPIDLIQRLLAG